MKFIPCGCVREMKKNCMTGPFIPELLLCLLSLSSESPKCIPQHTDSAKPTGTKGYRLVHIQNLRHKISQIMGFCIILYLFKISDNGYISMLLFTAGWAARLAVTLSMETHPHWGWIASPLLPSPLSCLSSAILCISLHFSWSGGKTWDLESDRPRVGSYPPHHVDKSLRFFFTW